MDHLPRCITLSACAVAGASSWRVAAWRVAHPPATATAFCFGASSFFFFSFCSCTSSFFFFFCFFSFFSFCSALGSHACPFAASFDTRPANAPLPAFDDDDSGAASAAAAAAASASADDADGARLGLAADRLRVAGSRGGAGAGFDGAMVVASPPADGVQRRDDADAVVRRWDIAFEEVHFHYQVRSRQLELTPVRSRQVSSRQVSSRQVSSSRHAPLHHRAPWIALSGRAHRAADP